MQSYFDQVGLVRPQRNIHIAGELDDALEWVEDRILEAERLERAQEAPLDLRESTLFRARKEETLAALEACMEMRSFHAGEKIFSQGDASDELYLIRRGLVRVVLPLNGAGGHHLATFGRGQFFGEMSFLDHAPRSADAFAHSAVDLYVLSRQRFETVSAEHKRLAIDLLEGLARALAVRLRHADTELRALQEN
jgi:SulP family sulfate permease